mmetsp:Transcript_31233/g.34562  ORF Transcript_31233/g.34562 Transcript_31233/m.34562 type:complete len:115 (-) Transcript_31233:26-370(-)
MERAKPDAPEPKTLEEMYREEDQFVVLSAMKNQYLLSMNAKILMPVQELADLFRSILLTMMVSVFKNVQMQEWAPEQLEEVVVVDLAQNKLGLMEILHGFSDKALTDVVYHGWC